MRRHIYLGVFIILVGFVQVISAQQPQNEEVQAGWESIARNDFVTAETCFQKAIQLDSTNPRPYLALSLIYQLREKEEISWKFYEKALKRVDNPNPYYFAVFLTKRACLSPITNTKIGLFTHLHRLVENPDRFGILRAGALSRLGDYHIEYGDFEKAEDYFRRLGTIDSWLLIGPFENISASGIDKVFPPENKFDLSENYSGKNGIPLHWQELKAIRPDKWIDFKRYYAFTNAIYYGNTFVNSPKKQTVHIRVGTSGSVKFFLNDQEIISCFDENNNDLDTYIAETELQQGWNRLLIKCGYSEINQCNFMVRITDPAGDPLSNLKVDTAPHEYPKNPQAPVKPIRNFAEVYFEEKIEQAPDQIENYLLLAECYLRNDKAPEAESVLRKALKLMPNAVLVMDYLLETYLRGEKYDEINTTKEKIYRLCPDLAKYMEMKFNDLAERDQIDEAQEIAEKFFQLYPNTEKATRMKLMLAIKRQQMEQFFQLVDQLYMEHPLNWDYAYLKAMIAAQAKKDLDEAIQILKEFLKKRKKDNAFVQLANTYLSASRLDEFEQTLLEALRRDPSGSGFYSSLAGVFRKAQQLDKAEKYIRKSIELAPTYFGYWSLLADILREKHQKNEAKEAYRTALLYNPKDYDSRARLRELEGKPPIFTRFHTFDIDSLISVAPSAEQYPEDGAVVLFEDQKRVVYPRGGTEFLYEMLVKVFNADGIDSFKENWIPYNANTEKLIVEKAVVKKSDGREIKADESENHLVFKSLEPNDLIYARWRIQSLHEGRLAEHFWDKIYFNYFIPIKISRYSLLVPEGMKFHQVARRWDGKTKQVDTPEGALYEWLLMDQPAVKSEYNMPPLPDVGKMLYISSIPSWEFIVDWYLDLTKNKIKTDFEIKGTVQELLTGHEDAGQQEKIRLIYDFITENIRYSSVPFRQSGLVPQRARNVLVHRLGDCKDVATLGIAMLKEIGVPAYYVLVNTYDEGLQKGLPPSVEFNHAIVAVDTGSGTLFMDFTAHNYPLGTVPEQDVGAMALLIKPGAKQPFYLNADRFMEDRIFRKTKIVLREDNSAFIERRNHRTGIPCGSLRSAYRYKSERDQRTELTESLSDEFVNVTLLNFTIVHLDTLEPEIIYNYSFTVPQFLEEAGSMKLFVVPWGEALTPDPALSYPERHHPLIYRPFYDVLEEEIEIELPKGYTLLEPPQNHQFSCSAADYTVQFEQKGNHLIAKRRLINKKDVISTKLYNEFKSFYNQCLKADTQKLLLKKL